MSQQQQLKELWKKFHEPIISTLTHTAHYYSKLQFLDSLNAKI